MEPTEAARLEGSDRFQRAAALGDRFLENIETVVHGKHEEIKLVLAALVCGGHVLFEDVPGTAKTVLARAIAQSIEGATPSRIQCTPDLQPTDVTGPSTDEELQIVDEQRHGHPLRWLQPVISVEDVHVMRKAVTTVYVDGLLQRWIVELVRATRALDEVAVGASVRGSLALERAARAWALLDHRPYVVPEDIEWLFAPVLLHRIVLRPKV